MKGAGIGVERGPSVETGNWGGGWGWGLPWVGTGRGNEGKSSVCIPGCHRGVEDIESPDAHAFRE